MLSKLLAPNVLGGGLRCIGLLRPPPPVLQPSLKKPPVRWSGHLIPPSQYDMPFPVKFKLTHALVKYWELIPMFLTVCTSFTILFIAIAWACKNKVDVVFTTHSINNISHTMNLRKPTVHKMVIINQRYDPWPEMQDVLDKMAVAEQFALQRATKCRLYTLRKVTGPTQEFVSFLNKNVYTAPTLSKKKILSALDMVDVVYTTHSRDNISRTMDLRNPSAHKMVLINQRYEPWPDMQRVLDRMKFAEKRALKRAGAECYPR